MGSVEEESRLVQMVDDFIESGSTATTPLMTHTSTNQTNCYTLLHEIFERKTKGEEAEVHERVLKHITNNNRDIISSTNQNQIRRLVVMKLKMDGYNASLCHTCWPSSFRCPAGDYEYIDINTIEEEDEGPKRIKRRMIVDIDFKSQFEVARPTLPYKQLTESLPNIFVGTEDKLIQIISILCSAAKHSLTERGLHVPPWRSTAYVHSKYLSNHSNYNHVTNRDWTPPNSNPNLVIKKNKTRINLGGASALSTQFSNMSINCC